VPAGRGESVPFSLGAAAAAATRAFSFGDAADLFKFWELVIETSEAVSGASGKTLTPCCFMLVFVVRPVKSTRVLLAA
jgi:hypothetical protein